MAQQPVRFRRSTYYIVFCAGLVYLLLLLSAPHRNSEAVLFGGLLGAFAAGLAALGQLLQWRFSERHEHPSPAALRGMRSDLCFALGAIVLFALLAAAAYQSR